MIVNIKAMNNTTKQPTISFFLYFKCTG